MVCVSSSGSCIDSILVEYEDGKSVKHGGNGGTPQHRFEISTPHEQIIKVRKKECISLSRCFVLPDLLVLRSAGDSETGCSN